MLDFGAFKSLSTKEFQEKKAQGYSIIDVRRADEWEAYGVIPGSHTITFFDELGAYDLDRFVEALTQVVTHKEQPFILVCAHANRTKTIGEILGAKLGYKNIYELYDGIHWGWIDKGLETVRSDS